MSRIILYNTIASETSDLKNYLKKEPSFEVTVATNFEHIKNYCESLDGVTNIVLFGCGPDYAPPAVLQNVILLEELKKRWPDLQVAVVSFDRGLLEAVFSALPGKIKTQINLSAVDGLSEDEIVNAVRKVVAAAKSTRPKGRIPGVLLVDDEENILVTLRLVLLNGGFNKVFLAPDIEQALKVFKENSTDIDVCLIDYNLRGQTAERLIYAINDFAPRVKIFIISGEGKNKAFSWPDKILKICAGFLGKPFDIGEIVLAIDEALKNEVEVSPEEDRRPKILVIDDSPETGQIITGIFGEKFKIILAFDGESGIEQFQRFQPALVVLDYKLPNKNGLEVLNELIKITQATSRSLETLKVVVTTIERDPSVYTAFMKLGIKNFLYKPINLEDVEKAVKRELDL